MQSKDGPVEGAKIEVYDSSLGIKTGTFTGITGADGRATIQIWYGYKTAKTYITLNRKQIGKTVEVGSVTLEKTASGGGKVTVTILDGAGYYSDTTGGAGTVTFLVPEIGTFAVRISQEHYLPLNAETRLLQGEQKKPLSFELEPKQKPDQGRDPIEVTVVAKDTTGEKVSLRRFRALMSKRDDQCGH